MTLAQRPVASLTQAPQLIQGIEPDGEIAAFVPEFGSGLPVGPKAWHLLLQRPRHRSNNSGFTAAGAATTADLRPTSGGRCLVIVGTEEFAWPDADPRLCQPRQRPVKGVSS